MTDKKVHPSLGPEDSLGGHSKLKRTVPNTVAIRSDADLTKHLRERERANAINSPSTAGIPELRPHSDKRDGILGVHPASGYRSTRVDTSSDGQISRPYSHVEHNKSAKDVFAGDYPGRARVPRVQVEQATERDPEKLREAKRRQFGSSGTN